MLLFVHPRYACCNVQVASLRSEPNHRAEQVTQLLFGEKAEVLSSSKNQLWVEVRCAHDGYKGWCLAKQLMNISKKQYDRPADFIVADHRSRLTVQQHEVPLPAGALLHSRLLNISGNKAKFKGKKSPIDPNKKCVPQALVDAATCFLHAPYAWGGRTQFGIDCSGLTQIAYRLCGINLRRDAWQQAEDGKLVDFLQYTQPGDLAFFDNHEGRINHVGIIVDQKTILHATETAGRTVLDKIDTGGIISVEHKRRTHMLRIIKRYI